VQYDAIVRVAVGGFIQKLLSRGYFNRLSAAGVFFSTVSPCVLFDLYTPFFFFFIVFSRSSTRPVDDVPSSPEPPLALFDLIFSISPRPLELGVVIHFSYSTLSLYPIRIRSSFSSAARSSTDARPISVHNRTRRP